ncbi:MAG: hypothetical protein DCF30_16745 [Hyphomicrobiales bacterium]|nr:MAG: hypothetical protein DCF30_16745 [Hyphomicrobiales bacterium]
MAGPTKKSVSKGSRCNNTAAIQHAVNLYNAGKNNLKVDGIFGDNTESAIKTLQRACGLDDDGKVGNDTGTRLFDEHSLTQTLTLILPQKVFEFTGKSLRPPALLDTAGQLLTRQKAVRAWTDAPRLEQTGIELPKLDLRQIGLKAATMAAHGVDLKGPFNFLQQLPKLNPALPHTLQFVGQTVDFRTITISYTVDKVLQPRTASLLKPYFKNEFTPGIDTANRELKVEFRSEVGLSSPKIIVGNYLEMGASANLWTNVKGAIGLGGAVGQFSTGLKVDARAVGHVFKSEFQFGPIKRTQVDVFGGFNLGVAVHGSFSSAGAVINIIPPEFSFSPVAGGSLTVSFD